MYKRLKEYLKKYVLIVKVHRFLRYAELWLGDVFASYFSKSIRMRMTPYGFRLVGSNSIHHVNMRDGLFEPQETLFLREQFRSTDVFVDVGANIGFYTCLARLADKHVIAIEPLLKNLEYLYANVLENHWRDVEIFPVGLSDTPGQVTLYGGSSTGASLIGGWAGTAKFLRRTIPVSTLDVILNSRFAGRKVFIKIDVEGSEYSVLLGAVHTMCMQPKPTWMVEICLEEFHPKGRNPDFLNTFRLFWQYGYVARTADQNNKLIESSDVDRWIKAGHCDSGTINYIFTSGD